MIIEAALYALSGFFMKFSDDAMDMENNTILGIIAGLICVAAIGYLAVNFNDAATIFLAILLGTLLAGKVDNLGHMVTLAIFAGILFIFGLPKIGLAALIICTVAAWLDEIGNDCESLKGVKIVETFFQYRCVLKIAVLVLAVGGGLQIIYPQFQIQGIDFFQPVTFIYFMLFDLAYEMAGLNFNRIYDGLKGLYRVRG